jgi:hypothetical protein
MQQLHLPGRLIAYDDIAYPMGTPPANSAIKHVRAPSPASTPWWLDRGTVGRRVTSVLDSDGLK